MPHPKRKGAWKTLIKAVASSRELDTWIQSKRDHRGRTHAYCQISLRHMPAGRNSGAPVYLACEELRAHQRRNIALMRTQAAAFVAAHAQCESGTKLFNSGTEYAHRHCIQPNCLGKNITDR